MNTLVRSGSSESSKDAAQNRVAAMLAVLLTVTLSVTASAQTFSAAHSVSSYELILHNSEITMHRLMIDAHSKSGALTHRQDYVFVPLANIEVLETVRAGLGHNPWSNSAELKGKVSWIPRSTQIRFVHPKDSEPAEGRAIANDSDEPYIALEIEIANQALPSLEPRFSFFTDHITDSRSWRLGGYDLIVQPVGVGSPVRFPESGEGILFSMSPVSLGTDSARPTLTLNVGQPLKFRENSSRFRNVGTCATTVMILARNADARSLALDVGH